jgi:hypothetical protein
MFFIGNNILMEIKRYARRVLLNKTARDMAMEGGLINLGHKEICAACGVAEGTFNYIIGHTFKCFVLELEAEGFPIILGLVTKRRVLFQRYRREHVRSEIRRFYNESNPHRNPTADELVKLCGVCERTIRSSITAENIEADGKQDAPTLYVLHKVKKK